ncbi:MAG: hypothetical protein KF745_08095 [Phycisphaeraceae bacterium]|nr:hypothetical protein [Phycisphaeraceae bacterium]
MSAFSSSPAGPTHGSARAQPLIRFDAGWLFLIAGLCILGATVLIPAFDDLAEARWQRDRAIAIEEHRLQRLERYGQYLDAVQRGEESVVLALAAEQLNKVPAGWRPLLPVVEPGLRGASVFPALEPPALRIPARERSESTLAKLAMGDRSRLWLLIGGGVCVLIGLLPPSSRPASPHGRAGQ